MSYDPDKHHRRSIRLRGYDYRQVGAYFVTICTYKRACLFGALVGGEMWLNLYGNIVWDTWHNLPKHYSHVELGAFVIMPNHIHGIIVTTQAGAGIKGCPAIASWIERITLKPCLRAVEI